MRTKKKRDNSKILPNKEKPLKLDMTFEEAMQKALNTRIPKGIKSGKKKRK